LESGEGEGGGGLLLCTLTPQGKVWVGRTPSKNHNLGNFRKRGGRGHDTGVFLQIWRVLKRKKKPQGGGFGEGSRTLPRKGKEMEGRGPLEAEVRGSGQETKQETGLFVKKRQVQGEGSQLFNPTFGFQGEG